MKRLCRAPSLALAQIWCDVLNRAGIEVTLQRLYQQGVAGDIPLDQVSPEIWLTNEDQLARARDLLTVLQNPPQRRWFCSCGEEIEGGFEQCWNCGAMRLSV